jgi:hypothetical protein
MDTAVQDLFNFLSLIAWQKGNVKFKDYPGFSVLQDLLPMIIMGEIMLVRKTCIICK